MITIIKIAFRNVMANKKRSFLLGLAIFVSSFLLIFSNAALNGMKNQVSKGYINIQSGHTIVMWENLKKTSNTEPGRFINPSDTISFDMQKNQENLRAIERLDEFTKEHESQIETQFKVVRRSASFVAEKDTEIEDTLVIYGLTEDSKKYMEDNNVFSMSQGKMDLEGLDTISISQQRADKHGLRVGDKLEVEVITVGNESRKKIFTIEGIYQNGAEYDNWYGYMSDKSARSLYQMNAEYFDVEMIFLNNINKAESFAKDLDQFLLEESQVLRSESYLDANTFYNTMPTMYKTLYNVFCIFILCIIAMGLRATIKMNIFQRMKEFGTLRAVGYSRTQIFYLIFFEILFLSIFSLLLAALVSVGPIVYMSIEGIHVGSGNLTNVLGGETFYASFQIVDMLIAFMVIIFFSMLSTFSPAIKLCYQNISDIMSKRQKKVKVLSSVVRSVFARG